MIILGLDLSLSSTGWNIITHENTILGYGKICSNAKKNTEFERIQIIANEIKELIEVNSIDIVVAENQFFGKNSKTGLTLSKLMGAVIYVCMEMEVQFELLSPSQARKILTGDGKLNKEQIADYIKENYIDIGEYSDKEIKTKGIKKSSDIYDSFCISLAWNKYKKLNDKYKK